MKTYYSAETGNFYSSDHFGTKTKSIIDPDFEWPMIEVPDPKYKGEGEAPLIEVRDESIEPPMIEVPNPNCKLPEDAVEISPEYHQELLAGQGNRRIEADANGYPILVEPPPLSIGELAEQKRAELDRKRDEAINAGFTHTFGDTDDVVQTRQRDRENLTGLAVSAQRHADETFYFRAKSNATFELTAEEMLALADAAQAHVSQQYARSWQLKAEIDAAMEAEDRDAIQALSWSPALRPQARHRAGFSIGVPLNTSVSCRVPPAQRPPLPSRA